MDLSNLKPAKGSINKNSKRVGRGQGSGKGGTATRGHKGAKSRSGYSKKLGFEGVVISHYAKHSGGQKTIKVTQLTKVENLVNFLF